MGRFRGAYLIAFATVSFSWVVKRAPADVILASPVAITAQAAPGTSGTFASFQRPLLNNLGDVAFIASYAPTINGAPSSQGIWMEEGTSLGNITHAGQDAPGTGSPFNLFQD